MFDYINRVHLPDTPNSIALFYFYPDAADWREPVGWVGGISVFWIIIIFLSMFDEVAEFGWLPFFIMLSICSISALFITLALYVPMRLLFIACTNNGFRIVQKLAAPLVFFLPGILLWFVFHRLDNVDPAAYTPPWTSFFAHAVRITVFALLPFFVMFTVIVLTIVTKLAVMVINLIALHIFKKASEKQQPFTYAAGLVTVIIAIMKIIDEIKKLS